MPTPRRRRRRPAPPFDANHTDLIIHAIFGITFAALGVGAFLAATGHTTEGVLLLLGAPNTAMAGLFGVARIGRAADAPEAAPEARPQEGEIADQDPGPAAGG